MSAWLLVAFVACMPFPNVGTATRPRASWPISMAFNKADVVLIARATGVRDVKEGEAIIPKDYEGYLSGIVTSFKVEQVIKGTENLNNIELIHFKYTPGKSIDNGPDLVSFRLNTAESKKTSSSGYVMTIPGTTGPDYMLFLKKRIDGRYEPISGQIDPDDSVKIVQRYQ